MDLRQLPTLEDFAKMLDSIEAGVVEISYPETLYVLRWLIDSSPPARELHDRLHARRDGEPSLIELARLIVAAETGESYPEAVYTALWLIQQSPAASEHYHWLQRMANDAGFEDRTAGWAVNALEARAELDRLLATCSTRPASGMSRRLAREGPTFAQEAPSDRLSSKIAEEPEMDVDPKIGESTLTFLS